MTNSEQPLTELSTELYVSPEGLLTETVTHKEVIGVCLSLNENSTEAWFQYIINDEYED